MLIHEIEEYIKPLSRHEKTQLIQDIAEMLKPDSDSVLHRFEKAARQTEHSSSGPLEA